ncbi:MAG: hypothetical protein R3A78_07350 [Polyangiales bacterium]|nr:hypothetical protein [Myxococcales bacterium]
MRSWARWVWAWLWVLGACGGAETRGAATPEEAVERMASALRRGDAATTEALTDPRGRTLTPEERADVAKRFVTEHRALAKELEDAARGPIVRTARVPLANGEFVTLHLENGEWRVDGAVLDPPVLSSPEEAALAMKRALASRDLDTVVRVLAEGPRDALRSDLASLDAALADPSLFEVSTSGDSATIVLPDQRRILLVKEGPEWRVLRVEEAPNAEPTNTPFRLIEK